MIKNLKTVVIMTLVLTICVVGLAGCSKETAQQEPVEQGEAQSKPIKQEDSYEQIREQGQVVMGLDDTFAPMGFGDEENASGGFDVD